MRRAATAIGLVGLFVIVMLASSVQGIPRITPPDFARPDTPPQELPQPSGSPTAGPLPEPESDLLNTIIGVVFLLIAVAVGVLLVILIVRALMRAWRDRPLRRRDGGEVDTESTGEAILQEPDAVAPAIRRGVAGALRSIAEGATPTDAIVAAWVGLEESASDAGITRGRSETPSEFAMRIITRRAGITEAATSLLALYERVRFGGHEADEQDRAAAHAALTTIEEGWR
ncbi:DUF4129 domain-containing protein [Microbacterium sp. YMB-B2]|uniref:DUF4129 domain-containing protein n=1 Tax=Microbacterium tenebrionis TaxID=2830665 RepID=A0A9X1LQ81_9MICO|nr:DUF4129 domain-containing protein [Microbacterium tenebrionis]MCC2029766.1 DUF4129 domain-containing protein [Microbacterium tenebrionis]